MTLLIERKSLNEKECYDIEIENNETLEAASPYDNTVIELLYEIITNNN